MIRNGRKLLFSYDIDEYDERFLRHLLLGVHKRK